jgi:beta-lactamase class A
MSIISRHKNKIIIIVVIAAIAFAGIKAFNLYTDYKNEKTRWDNLREEIIAQSAGFKGQVFVYIKDYNRNWHISIDSDVKVPAASIVKIPIMAAVFEAQKKGRLSLSDKIKLQQKDKAGGSGSLKNERAGKEFSIQELIMLMMSISDNSATNILISLLGMDNLNQWFQDNGLKDTNLSRLMMDMASRDKGIENYTTAYDIALILDRFYNGKFISGKVSSECMEIMKLQKTKNRIPAKLPADTKVLHKTGLEKGICHDAGIVFTPNGDFLISVLTRHEYSNSYKSRELISNIAYIIYKYYIPE